MSPAARLIGVAGVAGVVALPASAVELRLSYPAVERLLVTNVLSQGGRLYLEGAPGSDCRYAFIQEPRVSTNGQRLRVRVLFSGRAGTRVAGRCLGPGDTLELDIEGVPVYADGRLRLDQLSIAAPDSAYFKLVSGLVTRMLRDRLSYPLRDELQRALGWLAASSVVRLSLTELAVQSVEVGPEALVLRLDTRLGVD
jgi:hypothetical protein